ncbi:MAG: serine/threonine-protein kinase [Acidobacteriia bacterium]|nr:serine/threonine-protein kinase [Terriglobia bacterium]
MSRLMALTSGTKLGPYEIQSPLGAGGMGEVYRARDTRLDRTVAVKILPVHLSDNPEAKQRFEREARAISSLNHPNICTLHDIGSQDGTSYLVMEYVQGETLDSRLQKGPLPLKQALETGMQICDALEKAHRAGIVHRDLKPGNIMLTAAGAKLLDFGLAKPAAAMLGAQSLHSKGSDKANLTPSTPTMNLSMLSATPAPLTQQGTIVGTFQYMAPEVVQGREADARSDIFSLGCVLYEMITGKRAFDGKSQLSVLSAILEKEPEPISKIQPLTPTALDHVVHDCLAKDPDARWQNAADVARELRWIASGGSSVVTAAPESPRDQLRERLLWAAVAVLGALLASFAWLNLRGREPMPALRSYLPPPAATGFDFTGDFSGPPSIAPDGSAVAFCARGGKEQDSIWVQSFSELGAKKLEGTDGASFPFWSADAKFLGFFADGHLKKVPAAGGPVTVLADAPNARGGSWSQDNVIIYEPDYRDSLWRTSANGGTPVRLTKFEAGKHTTHRWPRFLPDGKHFLFFATNHSGNSEQGIYFGSLEDGSYKRVVDSDSEPQYASGYLLYHLQSQLLAQRFDPAKGVVSGDPVTVANFVEYDAGTWHTTFTVSDNGLLVYEPGSKTLGTDLFWLDSSGKTIGKIGERAFYKGSGRLSPDGKRLAVSMGDPQADIWVFDLARGSRTRLTFGGATHLMPSWSADGQRVVYVRQSGATVVEGTSLRARLASGGGQEEVLMEHRDTSGGTQSLLAPQWSPDGRYILHTEQSGPTGAGVWALPTTGAREPIPIVQPPTSQARIIQFRLSPDGRWLAYSSTESGREEVYVTHFPSGAGKWQVSQTGGTFPVWRGDSKEIYFIGTDGSVHSAGVNAKSEEFELAPVRTLFQVSYIAPVGNPYDVSADGQRFVFTTLPESVSTPLVLVTNWAADLKK